MDNIQCPNCNAEVIAQARFCPSCGFRFVATESIEEESKSLKGVRDAVILYFILLAVCAVVKFGDIIPTFRVMNIVEGIICATIIVFAVLNRKALLPAIINRNIKWWLFPVIAITAIVSNLGIGFLVDLFNKLNDDIFYTYMYDDTANPLLWSILSIAVQPAIFEELAFRGVMYNQLEKVMDVKAVFIVTGMLFAILHISPVSIIWLLPFGILTAWMRKKSGHLWYGIAFHFFFNLTYVLTEAKQRGWLGNKLSPIFSSLN